MEITVNTSFSDIDVSKIRAEMLELIDAEQITRAKLANESGVAEGTLGPFLNDKYAGRQEPIALKLLQWLQKRHDAKEAQSQLPSKPTFQNTLTSKKLLGIFSKAHIQGDIVVLGLGPGTGKTTTGREYQKTRPNVYMPTFDPTSSNVNTCLVEVLDSMGFPDAKGTPQALSRQIIAKVREADALFILDEAQHLQVKSIELLRAIHDRTGCGMAFVGDERIFDVFGANKGGQYSQLTSRIGYRHRQTKPKLEDVETLVKAHGITDKKVFDVAYQISQKPGALRGLTKALMNARHYATISNKHVDAIMVADAWSSLAPEYTLTLK